MSTGIKYISTRGGAEASASRAVIDGIAPNGGLYVPTEFVKLDYKTLFGLDYAARCDRVLRAFFDFDIEGIADDAYTDFEDGDPAPAVKLDDKLFVLELWHGKTHAFKDMALSVLPRLLCAAKKAEGDGDKTLVLVATSGDTGKAALEGFKDVEGTSVCVFYPTDGVSRVQKLAMQTQAGDNVNAVGVVGNFDDAQSAVKIAFSDGALGEKLKAAGVRLSSANSINIGRLVPQVAYYFSTYCDLVDSGEIKAGEKIDFVVPTGNFGNILAGYYALRMGLPVNKLVCASNKNNVLSDFVTGGIYDANREFFKTSSPSMDILVSSNLERLIFELSGRNAALTAERMAELKATGRYEITAGEHEKMREVFACGYADEGETETAIADMFDEYGYLIDPHTAVAYSVAKRRGFSRPTVVVSTANPYKFAPAVLKALGEKTAGDANEKMLEKLCDITAMDIPESLIGVFGEKIRFNETVDSKDILGYITRRYSMDR
ncbi:MAG: threonine synthase [Clostridiales bacterium]|nr:threonine synthase [Clostridiales bacterium]